MPISRVRSVTVTIMMLVMPMPPTSRLMPATAPSSTVNVFAVSVRVDSSWDWLRIRNGSLRRVRDLELRVQDRGDLVLRLRRPRSGAVACTRIWLSAPYPVSDARTALTGAIAMSLGSLKPAAPLSASTPTTVNRVPADGDLLADRVDRREQVVGDGLTDQHDLAVRGHVGVR